MDTALSSLETPDQQQFRQGIRQWLAESLPDGWGTDAYDPPATEPETIAFLRSWRKRLFDGGWAGLAWPKEYGGRGATLMEQAIFLEESDRVKAPPDIGLIGTGMVGPMLIHEGTDVQKRRYLRPILTGDEIWCQGFSEPNAGSDLASLTTRAEQVGDRFIISGQKIWTSLAHVSQLMLLLARTNPTAPKHKGITAFIVPMDTRGIEARPIRQINGGADFSEVFFDGARVPADSVIGAVDRGWQIALRTLAFERVATTRAFEARRMWGDLVRAAQRETPSGHRPIDSRHVRVQLAQLYCEVHAARIAYYQGIARQMASGAPGPAESVGKLHTSELCKRIASAAISILGFNGLTGEVRQVIGKEAIWPYEYVTTLKHTIAAGTSQVQRNIIGEHVLGLPR